jgi:hypothetical protein
MIQSLSMHVSGAKLAARNRGASSEIAIMHREIHIRKPRATMQRSKSAAVISTPTGRAEASITAPPRMEPVARTQRKPSHVAPSAEAKSEAAAEAKE